VSKHCSREREKKKRGDGIYGQATKGTVREETSMFYIEKSTRIL